MKRSSMLRTWAWAPVAVLAALEISSTGCASKTTQSSQVQAVAVVNTVPADPATGALAGTTVVFVDQANSASVPDILADNPPTTFNWVAITVYSPADAGLATAGGVTADLTDTQTVRMRFQQVYWDVCNPATRDFSQCHLYESYTSGDQGLVGTIHLQTTATTAQGLFDVTWEGQTDRFGPPTQYYKHGTSTGVAAPIKN